MKTKYIISALVVLFITASTYTSFAHTNDSVIITNEVFDEPVSNALPYSTKTSIKNTNGIDTIFAPDSVWVFVPYHDSLIRSERDTLMRYAIIFMVAFTILYFVWHKFFPGDNSMP